MLPIASLPMRAPTLRLRAESQKRRIWTGHDLTGRIGPARRSAGYWPQARKASSKARAPGVPFSTARMARLPFV